MSIPTTAPTTTRAGASGTATPTTAPLASAPGPTRAAAPAPLAPAAPGTYQYDTAGQTSLGAAVSAYPAATTLVVDPAVGNRQHSVRDLRDPARTGPVFDSVFEYRPDGLYLVNLTASVSLGLFSDTEQLAAPTPVLLLPTGAGPGFHRDLDLPTQSGMVAHVAFDVVRQEKVKTFDTRVLHIVAALPGPYNAHFDLTVWLAPTSIWVREHVVADATALGIAYRTEYDATLRG